MKKLFITLSLFISVLCSCEKDFDPKLYGVLSPSVFPLSEEDYELAMLSLYIPFQSKWGYEGQLGYQNCFFSPEYGHIVEFDASSDLMPLFRIWGGFWEGYSSGDFTFLQNQGRGSHFEKIRYVTSATQIIDRIEKSSVIEPRKIQFLAESKMARGWIMYNLLQMYGPVPVILDPKLINTTAEADLTRPSREVFVKSIESDLRFAADNLPVIIPVKDYGRFNKGCALTVLMRLYLNEKDFVRAESIGREIKSMGIYSLVNDYSGLFREATERNTETIWAVSCNNGSATGNFNALPFYCLPVNYASTKINGGWQMVFSMNWSFYDRFEPGDKRKALLIDSYIARDGSLQTRASLPGAVIKKYPDEGGAANSEQGNDIVVCRYADVLLMLSEAINENSGPVKEAVDLLNAVRERAGASLVNVNESASKDSFRDALFIERGKELYLEGLRKMDLIRMGKWPSAMIAAGKSPGPPLFPVPNYAITNSNGQLTQTAGY